MTSFLALAPLLATAAGALVVLLIEAFGRKDNKDALGYISILALLLSGFFSMRAWGRGFSYFGSALVLDRFALILCLVFVAAGAFIILMSLKYIRNQGANFGEFYALILLSVAGMMMMASSGSLLVIFLGLEVLSVSSYALTGLKKKDPKSSEAAVKYFLMGSFASAFLVFGLALLYGASRSLDIEAVRGALLRGTGTAGVPGWAGLALVVAGFGFKVAVAPFHMWAPDVYEGAPTPVSAFLTTGPKIPVFAVLFRVLAPLWSRAGGASVMFWLVSGAAILTMLIGNLTALRQRNLKRLLAYSSIAHSGYILVGLVSGDGPGIIFYLVAYLLMNAGAFGALIAVSRKGTEYVDIEDFAGLGFRYPWIGASLAVFLFSLAGFPPTAGFLAKFYVFSAAVRQGHVALAVIAVLASLISVFYYLRVVVFMYMRDPLASVEIERDDPALYLVLFLCLYGVIQLGLWPGNLMVVIRQAAASLF